MTTDGGHRLPPSHPMEQQSRGPRRHMHCSRCDAHRQRTGYMLHDCTRRQRFFTLGPILGLLLGLHGAAAIVAGGGSAPSIPPDLFQRPPVDGVLYDRLGVGWNATLADIQRSYRRLAVKLHPDKHGDDEELSKQFKSVVCAYETLSHPTSRLQYHLYGTHPEAPSPPPPHPTYHPPTYDDAYQHPHFDSPQHQGYQQQWGWHGPSHPSGPPPSSEGEGAHQDNTYTNREGAHQRHHYHEHYYHHHQAPSASASARGGGVLEWCVREHYGGKAFEPLIGQLPATQLLLQHPPEGGKSVGVDFDHEGRIAALAEHLSDRLQLYVTGQVGEWERLMFEEAQRLRDDCAMGPQLLATLGYVYERCGRRGLARLTQHFGSPEQAAPTLHRGWFKPPTYSPLFALSGRAHRLRTYLSAMGGGMKLLLTLRKRHQDLSDPKVLPSVLEVLWRLNRVEIEKSVTHACKRLLRDPHISVSTLTARAHGLIALGRIFTAAANLTPPPHAS